MNSEKPGIERSCPEGKSRSVAQLVWGVALFLAGVGVFFRIPQVMPKVEKIEYFSSVIPFVRFCFYVMGALLVGGGLKKIYNYCYSSAEDKASDV